MIPTPPSDADLAQRAASGDREAGDLLALRHGAALRRVVAGRLGRGFGPADADLVCQQAWTLLYEDGRRRLRRYDPARPFLPFLLGVALNACRDFLRSERLRRGPPSPEGWEPAAPQAGDPLETAERARAVRGALDRLPPRDRLLLDWVDVHGLSHARAARMLGVAPHSVSVLAERARGRLRALLEKRTGML